MYFDLTIPRIGVHEAKKLMAHHRLYQLIDPRKGITVLRANFIEVGKVNADSSLAILLHENGVSEPVWVERLSNEASLKQAVDFIADARLCSLFILLGFCFTGLASVLMESLWQMTQGQFQAYWWGDHANMFEFSDNSCLNNVFS